MNYSFDHIWKQAINLWLDTAALKLTKIHQIFIEITSQNNIILVVVALGVLSRHSLATVMTTIFNFTLSWKANWNASKIGRPLPPTQKRIRIMIVVMLGVLSGWPPIGKFPVEDSRPLPKGRSASMLIYHMFAHKPLLLRDRETPTALDRTRQIDQLGCAHALVSARSQAADRRARALTL